MNRSIINILCLIIGFILGYQLFLKKYPDLLYLGAKRKINTAANVIGSRGLPNADSRFVVKPNPDFLYATCFYDLKNGPMRLTGNMPDSTYWSVALYEPNTVNFYVKNDLEFNSNQLDMVLTPPNIEGPKNDEDFEIIKTPNMEGLILFRILVTDNAPENVKKYQNYANSIKIEPL